MMDKLTQHPEVIAEELRRNPERSKEAEASAAGATNRVVCLSYSGGGHLRLSWSVNSPGTYDWVGLYGIWDKYDSEYINGAWQWVSNGKYYDTGVLAHYHYQARYLVWDATFGRYTSVARTGSFPDLSVRSVSTAYPRPATDDEWDTLQDFFPSLNRYNVLVTGPATPNNQYNCIAWSLGYDDRWINPASPLSSFVSQYQSFGYASEGRLATAASIDGWGLSDSDCTHGSKRYTGTGASSGADLWESKLGPYLRITHGREGLNGTYYGHILNSFKLSFNVSPSARLSMATQVLWSEADGDKLSNAMAAIPEERRNAFEAAFAAWEASWNRGPLVLSSDSKDRARGEEFEALVAMGPEIIPLVVKHLRDPSKHFALLLYDALQSEPELTITYADQEKAGLLLEGEQMRAQRTIRLWLDSL